MSNKLLSSYPRLSSNHSKLNAYWQEVVDRSSAEIVFHEQIQTVFESETGTKKVWRKSLSESGGHYVNDFLITDEETLSKWLLFNTILD